MPDVLLKVGGRRFFETRLKIAFLMQKLFVFSQNSVKTKFFCLNENAENLSKNVSFFNCAKRCY